MSEYLAAVVSVVAILLANWGFWRNLKTDNENITKTLNEINMRLGRLEAKFEERGYWESRIVQFAPEPKKKKAKGE